MFGILAPLGKGQLSALRSDNKIRLFLLPWPAVDDVFVGVVVGAGPDDDEAFVVLDIFDDEAVAGFESAGERRGVDGVAADASDLDLFGFEFLAGVVSKP